MTALRLPRRRGIAVLTATAALMGLLPVAPAAAADGRTAAEIRDRIEYLVNRTRARHDLRRLDVNLTLQRGARGHACDMAAVGAIFHDAQLALELPSGADAWGENVGYTSATDAATRIHQLFMDSPGHRDNVLRRRWRVMGIGVCKGGGRTWVTERFVDR